MWWGPRDATEVSRAAGSYLRIRTSSEVSELPSYLSRRHGDVTCSPSSPSGKAGIGTAGLYAVPRALGGRDVVWEDSSGRRRRRRSGIMTGASL